jgi:hypothetical protein
MAMPIMTVTSKKPRKQTPSRRSSKEFEVIYQGSAGPRELLELIAIQARAAIKGLETGVAESASENRIIEIENLSADNGKAKEQDLPVDKNLLQLQAFW